MIPARTNDSRCPVAELMRVQPSRCPVAELVRVQPSRRSLKSHDFSYGRSPHAGSSAAIRRPLRRLLCSMAMLGACGVAAGGEVGESPPLRLPALPATETSVAPHELLHEIEGVESEKAVRLRQLQNQPASCSA